jgi:hypothetical protein
MNRKQFAVPASRALAVKPGLMRSKQWREHVLRTMVGSALVLALGSALLPGAPQIKDDQKGKIIGTIVSRNGDIVKVKNKKTGTTAVLLIKDNTTIERKSFKHEFFVHKDMDVTAMVPGLTIKAEGVGNSKGQPVAKTISFVPDTFSVEVAEEQQILANQTAAASAQTTANQGVQEAQAAQASANRAQASANRAQGCAFAAGTEAEDAGELAVYDAADIASSISGFLT